LKAEPLPPSGYLHEYYKTLDQYTDEELAEEHRRCLKAIRERLADEDDLFA
jgi:hypothetical protein